VPTSIDGNAAAREAILARVCKALGKAAEPAGAEAARAAAAYVLQHARGPQPSPLSDVVGRFVDRAIHMQSTVERIAARDQAPAAVSRYLEGLGAGVPREGVCWPEFADLDWTGAGLVIESRPTVGHDKLGITGCFGAIAETGTLVIVPGATMHTATALLPDTHVVVVNARDVVATMEDAFVRLRAARGHLPRSINLISGPSRTGDIEQTIVLGAHGPFRVHVLLVG